MARREMVYGSKAKQEGDEDTAVIIKEQTPQEEDDDDSEPQDPLKLTFPKFPVKLTEDQRA